MDRWRKKNRLSYSSVFHREREDRTEEKDKDSIHKNSERPLLLALFLPLSLTLAMYRPAAPFPNDLCDSTGEVHFV